MSIPARTRGTKREATRVSAHYGDINQVPPSSVMHNHVKAGLADLANNTGLELRQYLFKSWPRVQSTPRHVCQSTHKAVVLCE